MVGLLSLIHIYHTNHQRNYVDYKVLYMQSSRITHYYLVRESMCQ